MKKIIVIPSNLNQGKGRQGDFYLIPVKNKKIRRLPLDRINYHVQQFLYYAKKHPKLRFVVKRFKVYTEADIAPMFRYAPMNCKLTFKSNKLRLCPTCKRPL